MDKQRMILGGRVGIDNIEGGAGGWRGLLTVAEYTDTLKSTEVDI